MATRRGQLENKLRVSSKTASSLKHVREPCQTKRARSACEKPKSLSSPKHFVNNNNNNNKRYRWAGTTHPIIERHRPGYRAKTSTQRSILLSVARTSPVLAIAKTRVLPIRRIGSKMHGVYMTWGSTVALLHLTNGMQQMSASFYFIFSAKHSGLPLSNRRLARKPGMIA